MTGGKMSMLWAAAALRIGESAGRHQAVKWRLEDNRRWMAGAIVGLMIMVERGLCSFCLWRYRLSLID